MSDDHTPMRLIASIGSAVANIQHLAEHFESLAGEADCRPAAAERGETVRAMVLQAAAHAAIAALAEKAHTTAHGARRRHRRVADGRNATMMPWRERLIHSLGLCVPRPRRHRIDAPRCRSPHTPPASASLASLAPHRWRLFRATARTLPCPVPPAPPMTGPPRSMRNTTGTHRRGVAKTARARRRVLDEPGMRSGPKRATQMNRETPASRRVPHTSWDSPREETSW